MLELFDQVKSVVNWAVRDPATAACVLAVGFRIERALRKAISTQTTTLKEHIDHAVREAVVGRGRG
jgi:hypothetical protein